jgi:hypothetical protein
MSKIDAWLSIQYLKNNVAPSKKTHSPCQLPIGVKGMYGSNLLEIQKI